MRDFRRFVKGVTFKPNDGGSNPIGDLSGVLTAADNGSVYHYQHKLKAFLDAVEREIITNDQTQTITNKTIDADNNTISNIENDNIKAGAAIEESKLDLDYSTSGLNTAITDHINDTTDAHDASAVSFNNAASGLTATEVQGAIDEVEGRLQTAEGDISNHIADTVDAHDASAISSVPSGNLAATDVQGALNELQSDIDTRALNSDLSNHINDITDAHDASAISFSNVSSGLTATEVQGAIDEIDGRVDAVETAASGAQTSIDNHLSDTVDAHDASAISSVPAGNLAATDVQGALNELQSDVDTRALNSDLSNHTSASTNVHGIGVGSSVVGTATSQTLTNKTISGASIESPIRSDVKKDTKANLETYATTASNGQLCFATDEKIMYQVVDGLLTEVGAGGGVGSVDIMFADTFDSTAITEYSTTGTVALTESALEVLQGKKSLKITHTGGASAERVIPVDIKFRNKNVTMSFDVESDAASGNLTLTVVDNTNTVTLVNAESIQPQESLQTSVKRSVSFIIPDDCEELKYTITAVSESGKISIIDNVVIELTQTAKMSTTIETPIVTEWQDYNLVIGATTTAPTKGTTSVDKAQWRRVGQDMEIRYDYKQTGAGTAGSGNYLFPIPSGYTVDTSRVPMGTAEQAIVGVAKMANGTTATGAATVPGVVLLSKTYPNNFTINYAQTSTENTTVVSSAAYPLNSATIGFSFTAKVPIVGWSATESQEVSLAQAVLKQESDDVLHVAGVLGYGSTNTKVVRFDSSSIQKSLGDAITYIPSATLGDSFKINEAGVYQINATVGFQTTTGNAFPYIVKNPTNLEQSTASSIPVNEVISHAYPHGGASGNPDIALYANVYLEKDDVIWVTNPVASPVALNTGNRSYIQITKQGSLKQVNVTENQKIEIPTSELRMEGASTRGSTATAIVRFGNIAKIRGDAFEVVSNAVDGTYVRMKKAGKLAISSSNQLAAAGNAYGISINQSILTTAPIASETLAANSIGSYGTLCNASALVDAKIGDIIRVFSVGALAANAGNSLNLSFQEQDIQVSVSNTLPQFSESDSCVRLNGANGFGSTATTTRRFASVQQNIGNDIQYTDSATLGGQFRAMSSGIYNVSYSERSTTNIQYSTIYITINGTSVANSGSVYNTANVDSKYNNVSWQGFLNVGDIVSGAVGAASQNNGSDVYFTISKVGKPNVTGVDVTPFAKIEYEVKDEVQANTHAGYGSTNNKIPYYTNITANTNRGLIRVENSASLGFSITVLKDCELTINSTHVVGSSIGHGLTLNSASLTTDILSITPPQRLVLAYTAVNDANQAVSTSYTGLFKAGDVIRPHTTGTAPTQTNRCNISVVATELRDAYQVIGGGVENTYSARITSAGAITSQSYPFIDSVTKGGTGSYTINLKPGFFTIAPSVNATTVFTASDRYALVFSISTSTIEIRTFQTSSGTSAFDVEFGLFVQRQGSDYRTPSKAVGLPQQRVAIIKDVKAAATAMQTIPATTWTTRVLNNLVDPTGIVTSLASNTFSIPAGRYYISAKSPVLSGSSQVSYHKAALYNVTDAAFTLIGSTERTLSPSGSSHTGSSHIEGTFTITSAKTFDIRHIVSTGMTPADTPLNASSTDEIYTIVVLTRIEE